MISLLHFWEIFFRQQQSEVSLQRLTNSLDKGDILYQYSCKTIPYSFVLNQDNLYSVSSRVFDIYFKYNCQKLKPILSVDERLLVLKSLQQIDYIIPYTLESDLLESIQSFPPDVRFLGDDYIGKKYTGDNLNIPVIYLDRTHGWSTTKFKTLIANTVK